MQSRNNATQNYETVKCTIAENIAYIKYDGPYKRQKELFGVCLLFIAEFNTVNNQALFSWYSAPLSTSLMKHLQNDKRIVKENKNLTPNITTGSSILRWYEH